jgi:hypothetical protein
VLERRFGVHFFHVEALWMAYYAQCKAMVERRVSRKGSGSFTRKIQEALTTHGPVCVETTRASPEILSDLLSLAPAENRLVVRLLAPLELCLQRDQTRQIPMDVEDIKKVYQLSTAAENDADLVLENAALAEEDIMRHFESALTFRS